MRAAPARMTTKMSAKELSGLFINCVEARCSIYESGKMTFQCLSGSEKYSLDYVEIAPDSRALPAGYDFYIFNYHIVTMPWLDTGAIKKSLPGLKMTLVLEVSPNDPFVCCSPDDFDAYCVLDPTLSISRKNVFAFPRPLETISDNPPYEPKDVPVIGSFGFATKGKGFEHLIDAVNREFERAVVRINIPYATYADESRDYAEQLAEMCKGRAASGIEVTVTHDYMAKDELIKWCGQNTINCFLYDRNMPGLAATTDQAISSGRPLSISKNPTFRHIQKYIKPFPYQTLKDAIATTGEQVKEIQKAWSPEKFRQRFEEVLGGFQFDARPKAGGAVKLAMKEERKQSRLTASARYRLGRLSKIVGLPDKIRSEMKRKDSYSEFGEDILVSDLLDNLAIQNIYYLEIGGDDPRLSNTYLFYRKGFGGVLIKPYNSSSRKLKADRPRDLVLHTELDAPSLNLNQVIENYFTECPDFVSVDVEESALKILETLDFEKYSPAVFCVAAPSGRNNGSGNQAVRLFFERRGYFQFKETGGGTIFVNKNLYDFYLYQKEQRELRAARFVAN